jgi:hypothetical protein
MCATDFPPALCISAPPGEQLYLSNIDFGLVPVVGENYGTSGAGEGISYFGVAVVKKEWCDARTNPTFSDLMVG